jgi:uncharacterized protein involved in exopolysaccharide biosynthesis
MDAVARHAESDTRELLRRLRPHRWLIAASTLLLASAAAVAAFVMTPYYESKAVLVPAHNERSGGLKAALDQLGGLTALAGLNIKEGDEQTQEAIGVLKSRQFTGAFISDKGLMEKFFAKKWNAASKTWKGKPDQWPTPNKAYTYFDERVLTVISDKKTGLVTLSIVWKDRAEAAEWANELVARLNAEMRRRAIARSNSNIGYLQGELKNGSYVEIRDAINHLIEAQIRDQMVAAATEEFAFRVVDKAVVADKNEPVRPQKVLMIAGGAVLGLLLAALPVFFSSTSKPQGASGAPGAS